MIITINDDYKFSVTDLADNIARGSNTDDIPVDPVLAKILASCIMSRPNVGEAIEHVIDRLDGWVETPGIEDIMWDFTGWFFCSRDELEDFVDSYLT